MLKRITHLFIISLFAVAGLGITTSQQVHAASEAVFNDNDGSNYSFSVIRTDGVVVNVAPGGTYYGQIKAFKLFSWECAKVSYNYGPWYLRGPGTHYISDGALVHVNPHVC